MFFLLLTICASPSTDFLGHREHGWRQNLAHSVWMNMCWNQLCDRGSPHRRTSLRLCSGLKKASKLKPYLKIKIFSAVRCTRQWMLCCDISPKGTGCHDRLTERTEECVQLHESAHMTDRFVMGICYVTGFCRDSKSCSRGRCCMRPCQHSLPWCHFYSWYQKLPNSCLPSC